MMCQYRFVICNKCIAPVGDVDHAGGCEGVVGAGNTHKISVPSIQFCCKPETSIKNKVYFFKKERKHHYIHL